MAALIHGHTHTCVFYSWDLTNVTGAVIDVYNAPALQKGGPSDPLSTPSQFLVFELDTTSRRLRAFQRISNEWGPIRHEKPLDAQAAERALPANATAEDAAVGSIRVRARDPSAVAYLPGDAEFKIP